MNNSTFGKAMEILGNRAYVRLVIDNEDIKNQSKSSLVSQIIFSKNLVLVCKIKEVLTLNKPLSVGKLSTNCLKVFDHFAGLALKVLMYDSHCNYIKNNMVIKLSYYLQIQTVYHTKVKQLMCTKSFTKIKTSLISAVIQRIENSMMNPIK